MQGQNISSINQIQKGTSQVTQAQFITQPIHPPGVVQRLSFSSENIKRLGTDDFNIDSKEFITLKYDDCILILFYVENTESYQLANIWALVAAQVAGPIFAAINMLTEKRVAEAFTRLKSDGSNPLHWAALRQYPSIMVYRQRWPVAIYNGPREVQALIDYSLTLACEAGYYEILQTGGSMQGEARIEMGPYQLYTNVPGQKPIVRKESTQYTADEPIRGFNPNIPIVITGSSQAKQATSEVRAEETRQQQEQAGGVSASLTQEEEAAPTESPITGEPVPTSPTSPPIEQIPGSVSPTSEIAVPAQQSSTIPASTQLPGGAVQTI